MAPKRREAPKRLRTAARWLAGDTICHVWTGLWYAGPNPTALITDCPDLSRQISTAATAIVGHRVGADDVSIRALPTAASAAASLAGKARKRATAATIIERKCCAVTGKPTGGTVANNRPRATAAVARTLKKRLAGATLVGRISHAGECGSRAGKGPEATAAAGFVLIR